MGVIKDVENGILSFIWTIVFWGSLLFVLILVLATSGAFDSTTASPAAEHIEKTRYYEDENGIIPVQDKNGHYADITVEYLTDENGTIKIGKDGNFIKADDWECENGFCAPPEKVLKEYPNLR